MRLFASYGKIVNTGDITILALKKDVYHAVSGNITPYCLLLDDLLQRHHINVSIPAFGRKYLTKYVGRLQLYFKTNNATVITKLLDQVQQDFAVL